MRDFARVRANLAVVWLLLSCQTYFKGQGQTLLLLPSSTPLSLASCTLPATVWNRVFRPPFVVQSTTPNGTSPAGAKHSSKPYTAYTALTKLELELSEHSDLRTLPCSISTSTLMPCSYCILPFPWSVLCLLLSATAIARAAGRGFRARAARRFWEVGRGASRAQLRRCSWTASAAAPLGDWPA